MYTYDQPSPFPTLLLLIVWLDSLSEHKIPFALCYNNLKKLCKPHFLNDEVQNDPCTNAGRGSNLTEDGDVECDASIMDGSSGAFGAVGAVPGISI